MFFPSGWCFLPCDHGLTFDISLLCGNSINKNSKIKRIRIKEPSENPPNHGGGIKTFRLEWSSHTW